MSWTTIAESRYDWAWAARTKYLHRMKLDIGKSTSGAPRPYVSLYGPSQVGKTGLILRLLGLNDAALNRAGNVLRGEQPNGTPATVTAQVYRPNEDNHWSLREADLEESRDHTDCEFSVRLQNLRQRVHTGQFTSREKLHIGLPADLFHGALAQVLPIVVDLPGDRSSELREYEHVRRLMETFINVSTHVLVVVNAADLTKLGRLEVAGYPDWRSYGSKFRIILTHAVSSQSVSTRILGAADMPGINSKEELKDFYRKHLQDSAGITAEIDIYCVEFGYSWSQLQETVRRKVEPWIDSEINDLRIAIRQSTSPLASLSDFNFEQRQAKEKYRKEKQELEEEANENQQDIDNIREALEATSDEAEVMRDKLRVLDQQITTLHVRENWPQVAVPQLMFAKKNSVKAIQDAVTMAIDELWEVIRSQLYGAVQTKDDSCEGLRSKLVDIATSESITDLVEATRREAVAHLASHLMDSYWFDDSFREDCNTAQHNLILGASRIGLTLGGLATQVVKEVRLVAKMRRNNEARRLELQNRIASQRKDELNRAEKHQTNIAKWQEVAEREWTKQHDAMRESSEFVQLLDVAFLERLVQLRKDFVARGTSPLERHRVVLETATTICVKQQIDTL